jgi:hypothetical protein
VRLMYNGVHRGPIYVAAIMCLTAELTLHCASTSCSMRSRPAGNRDQCGCSCGTSAIRFYSAKQRLSLMRMAAKLLQG